MEWKWQTGSILNNDNARTASRDVFDATCHEFALYFQPKGGKYARSRKRISFEKNGVRLVIGFNSSRSNMRGDWIAVELGISFYYMDFIEPGKEYRGVILGDMDLFSKKLVGHPDGTIIIKKIIGDDIVRIEEGRESEEMFGKVFNCYGLTEADFSVIAKFLQTEVLCWLDKINDPNEIVKLVERVGAHGRWSMTNSRFRDFLLIRHHNLVRLFDEKMARG